MTEEKSDLVKNIEAIPRDLWEFDAANLYKRAKTPVGKFRMRVPNVVEQDTALRAADHYLKTFAENARPDVAVEILANAKIAYLIHEVAVDAKHDRPAFPSGKWLQEKFTSDQLAVLLNYYHECLRLSGTIDLDLDDEKIEGLAAILSNHYDSDVPNIVLTVYTWPQLGEIVVRLAKKLTLARAELAAALAALAPGAVTTADEPAG